VAQKALDLLKNEFGRTRNGPSATISLSSVAAIRTAQQQPGLKTVGDLVVF
jgi:hypothetical protein